MLRVRTNSWPSTKRIVPRFTAIYEHSVHESRQITEKWGALETFNAHPGYNWARARTHHTIWQKVLLKSPMIIRVQTSESQDSYLQMAMALFRAWTAMCVSFSANLMIGLPESISPSFFITCMYRIRLILTRLTILSGFTWTRGCWIVSQPIIADKLQHTIWLIACRDKEC